MSGPAKGRFKKSGGPETRTQHQRRFPADGMAGFFQDAKLLHLHKQVVRM
jgi:hypothetical protein